MQWVNRPNQDFRGFSGTVASAAPSPWGENVVVAASGVSSQVTRILGPAGEQDRATAGEAITICLADEVDVARGDVLAPIAERPAVADQFAAHVLWMDEEPMLPGRQYMMRIGNLWTSASVTLIKHRVDVATLDHQSATRLSLNEIGLQPRHRAARADGPLRAEPPDRCLHPGGPFHQPHRGLRDDQLRAAPRDQCAS